MAWPGHGLVRRHFADEENANSAVWDLMLSSDPHLSLTRFRYQILRAYSSARRYCTPAGAGGQQDFFGPRDARLNSLSQNMYRVSHSRLIRVMSYIVRFRHACEIFRYLPA